MRKRSKLKGEKERKEGEHWAPSAAPWGWASVGACGVWGLFLGRGFSTQALGTQDTLGVESGGTGPRAAVSLPPEVRARGQQAELVRHFRLGTPKQFFSALGTHGPAGGSRPMAGAWGVGVGSPGLCKLKQT